MGYIIAYLIVTPILGAIAYNIANSKDWKEHSDNKSYLIIVSYATGTIVYMILFPFILLFRGIASFF